MKASELTEEGWYWCSHLLSYCMDGSERVSWNVIEFDEDRQFWSAGGELSLYAEEIPDNVRFVGPLTPPG